MNPDFLAARAEFYLMLSRAFLPPAAEDSLVALSTWLPDDLHEICPSAGWSLGAAIEACAVEARALPDLLSLQQAYAGLFLQPPRKVQLYASAYLDGSILGRSADAIEACYREHGVERAESFHNLPDHLAVLLEFYALLLARAAEAGDEVARRSAIEAGQTFCQRFLRAWVPGMRRQIARVSDEVAGAGLYRCLAELLEQAMMDGEAGQDESAAVLASDPGVAEKMACCRQCGQPIAPRARLERVRHVLEQQGIDIDHLDRCPRCRGVGFPGAVAGTQPDSGG